MKKPFKMSSFFFFFFFFAFPSYISGVHHFWVRFLRMWPFFNPTIKVVTFCLRGWCVLGVFLLPAFTRLGHERQDLLSAMKCMCAQTRPWFILSSERVLGENGVWTHVNSKGKIPWTGKCPQRRIEPATLWTASPSTTNWAIPAPVKLYKTVPYEQLFHWPSGFLISVSSQKILGHDRNSSPCFWFMWLSF